MMDVFDQHIAARTAMGEARGQGRTAMQAVMWTGLNRFTAKRWYSGLTLAATFLKSMQYSCWIPRGPGSDFDYIVSITPDIPLFAQTLNDASGIVVGAIADPTQGATHYYDTSIDPPTWTKGATQTAQIGDLLFYKDVA